MLIRIILVCSFITFCTSCGGENHNGNESSAVPARQLHKIEMESQELGVDISEDVDVSISGNGNQIYVYTTSSFNALLINGSNNVLYLYSSDSMNSVHISGDDNVVFVEGSDEVVFIEAGLGNSIVNSDDISVNEPGVRVSMERNGRQFDSDIALPGL